MIEPTAALRSLADRHGVKFVFFVDAGFILRARSEMHRSARLAADHDAVCRQVSELAADGHEIQLHIHPHWEDSTWDGDGWRIDTRRYALHDFDCEQIDDIVGRYTNVLRELAGAGHAFAYRAGGWVIQPFAKLRQALAAHGVVIDSSVYRGGFADGAVHHFDFRAAPQASRWRFDDDPLHERPDGPFLEVPIASHRVWPWSYWGLAAARKLGGRTHHSFGDGQGLSPMRRRDLVHRLLVPSQQAVSLDGYMAGLVASAARRYRAQGKDDFVVIGHPKMLTPYSLRCIEAFIASGIAERLVTYRSYLARDAAASAGVSEAPSGPLVSPLPSMKAFVHGSCAVR
ncbi:hypothetical protein [Caldimonas sp. KR1-144]|uniref:hypothetical protein n=1 Tax=Caldimonas sp. KR1-144 TaxID=3400911 RepID=UPI003C09D273